MGCFFLTFILQLVLSDSFSDSGVKQRSKANKLVLVDIFYHQNVNLFSSSLSLLFRELMWLWHH